MPKTIDMQLKKLDPETALDLIRNELDGTEWNSSTLNEIAAILQAAGYIIKDVES